MSESKVWVKICFSGSDPGVVFEKPFDTVDEANAFVEGFDQCLAALDVDDDDHFACVDDVPALDEDGGDNGR